MDPPGVVRRLAPIALLIGAEVAALLLLHRLGSLTPFDLGADPDRWARAAPADALAAALRWVALGAAAWLLCVTVYEVGCALVAAQRPRPSRHRPRFAPHAVHRLVERAMVTGAAAGIALVPGVAHATRAGTDPRLPVVTVVRDGRSGDLASLPVAPRPTARPVTPRAPLPAAPIVAAAPKAEAHVTVAAGDNLWEIAARVVANARGLPRGTQRRRRVRLLGRAVRRQPSHPRVRRRERRLPG